MVVPASSTQVEQPCAAGAGDGMLAEAVLAEPRVLVKDVLVYGSIRDLRVADGAEDRFGLGDLAPADCLGGRLEMWICLLEALQPFGRLGLIYFVNMLKDEPDCFDKIYT